MMDHAHVLLDIIKSLDQMLVQILYTLATNVQTMTIKIRKIKINVLLVLLVLLVFLQAVTSLIVKLVPTSSASALILVKPYSAINALTAPVMLIRLLMVAVDALTATLKITPPVLAANLVPVQHPHLPS